MILFENLVRGKIVQWQAEWGICATCEHHWQARAGQGDAEDLPFDTDSFDRYVSAGSIGETCGASPEGHACLCGTSELTAPPQRCQAPKDEANTDSRHI